jgi:heme exporter protein A
MLQTIDLECSRGFRTLWSGVSFELSAGELLHVTGANGSGKTSLLRILCGLLEPRAGEVRWKGTATRRLAEDYRRELIYIGHANGVKDDLTAAENLRIACTFCDIAPTPRAIDEALDAFGLARYRDAPAKTLSQGQRRRVALARLALAEGHPLWLLDEPCNALDETAAAHVHRLIEAHLERGGIAVMASHERIALKTGRAVRAIELRESGSACTTH